MEKIKKYWKEILIGLLVLFGMNKCTQSCNRDNVIQKQLVTIHHQDSVIVELAADTLEKAHRIAVMNERINTANANTQIAIEREHTAQAEEDAAKAKAETAQLRNKLRK